MKKSGSTKRQDFEKLRLPNMGRQKRQLRKPPPPLATPQKQPGFGGAVDILTPTPNYMKSTSSSEARKERSQVSSSRSPETSPESTSSRRKSSSSSRMLSRILTKTPSFKPGRSSSKKSSPVVLRENLDVKRSICSATWKDYKFPSYLSLNPRGTETEGTSVIKVCPYNYCSLNGHKHAPVPPLKKFLFARRLMIKTQRGLKLGCLSPRRSKPAGDGLGFDRELQSQDNLNRSTISHLIQEEDGDFFVEIYGEKEGDDEKTEIDRSTSDEKAEEEENEDEEPCTDCNSSENFDQNGDDSVFFPDEIGAAEKIDKPSLAEEKAKLGCSRGLTEITRENVQSVQSDEVDSDGSNMDRVAGECPPFYIDDDHHDYSLEGLKECDRKGVDLSEVDACVIQEEAIFNPDENVRSWFDEILADEQSWSSESTGSYEYLDSLNIEITSFLLQDQKGKTLEAAKEDKNDIVFSDLNTYEEKQNNMMLEDGTSIHENEEGSEVPDNVSTRNLNKQYEENVGSPGIIEECQFDDAKIYPHDWEAFDGGVLPICDDPEADQNYIIQARLSTTDDDNRVDLKDQSDAAKPTGIKASDEESQTRNDEYQGHLVNHCNEADNFGELIPMDRLGMPELNVAENGDHVVQRGGGNATKADKMDTCLTRDTLVKLDNAFDTCKNLKATARCKRSIDEESTQFNPRAPNYLTVEPDPEAEKVDLKHQKMDERKNSEEWMLDYALRQAVTTLAPARKRKVALLVEAFEKVLPCDPNQAQSSVALVHSRPIQACR